LHAPHVGTMGALVHLETGWLTAPQRKHTPRNSFAARCVAAVMSTGTRLLLCGGFYWATTGLLKMQCRGMLLRRFFLHAVRLALRGHGVHAEAGVQGVSHRAARSPPGRHCVRADR
jgi:hypothetical protein